MAANNLVAIETLCTHYKVETTFVQALEHYGIINIVVVNESSYVQKNQLKEIEKATRLHHELEINLEGVDVIFNLLQKVDEIQAELDLIKNRLRIFENE